MSDFKCCADGCERLAVYKAAQLCQMHYFRKWRYGTLETRSAKPFYVTNNGYRMMHVPGHALANRGGYVYEQRLVFYMDVWPQEHFACGMCAKLLTWATVQVDHIDRNRLNNNRWNLRPLCRRCNTWRDMPPQHTMAGRVALTYEGKTMTVHEWSRDPRAKVSGQTIRCRLGKGFSPEQALFAPKVTHKTEKKPCNG